MKLFLSLCLFACLSALAASQAGEPEPEATAEPEGPTTPSKSIT